jgi:hypothetical protein
MQKHNLLSILLIFGSGVSVLNADSDDLLDQGVELLQQGARYATEMTKNSVNQVLTGIKNVKTPDLVDSMGRYPVALDTDLNLGVYESVVSGVNVVAQGMKDVVKNGTTPDLVDPMGQYSVGLDTTPNLGVYEKLASAASWYKKSTEELLENSSKIQPVVLDKAWYSKAWNAEIAGYKNAGKYVIVGSAVVVTALVTAYSLGYFSKTVTIEQMVDDLIAQAQENPNVVIVQLPKILASCKDDHMKEAVFKYVLSNITLTPEIKKAFNC